MTKVLTPEQKTKREIEVKRYIAVQLIEDLTNIKVNVQKIIKIYSSISKTSLISSVSISEQNSVKVYLSELLSDIKEIEIHAQANNSKAVEFTNITLEAVKNLKKKFERIPKQNTAQQEELRRLFSSTILKLEEIQGLIGN